MNHRAFVGVVAVLAFGLATPSFPQTQNPLVGAWERISLRDAEGNVTQPPAPAAFVIFSADGFFSQIAIPTGRARIDKLLDQMTKEELVQRFNRVTARRGTYTISGNRLTRKDIAHSNPEQEGAEQVQVYRIEGDLLILSSPDPKLKNEARFRRAK